MQNVTKINAAMITISLYIGKKYSCWENMSQETPYVIG